jgi:hypothetical protein
MVHSLNDAFAGFLPEPEKHSPFPELQQRQNDILDEASDALTPLGVLRRVPSSEIRDSNVSIGFECLDRDMFDPARCYDALAAAGVKHARCQTGWCKCEREKGVYTFEWLDAIVDNLLARGVKPWFNVGFGNKIYMPDAYGEAAVGHVPLYYGDETLQAWKNFVAALAERFKGRVTHWEIWNEPELPQFWRPVEPSSQDYLKLAQMTSSIIRDKCADAKIGASSYAARSRHALELIELGVAEWIDFHCIHAYKIVPEVDFLDAVSDFRAKLDANGGGHVEIWQGEAGFASHFPPNHWLKPTVMDSERNQAKWLLRRFATDRRAGCAMSSFFQMVDMIQKPYQMGNSTNSDPARHGILHGRTYLPKPSYYAMAAYCAVFDDATTLHRGENLRGRFFDSASGADEVSRAVPERMIGDVHARNGYPLYLYYLPEDVQSAYPGAHGLELICQGDPALKAIQEPVLVDLLKGRVYAVRTMEAKSNGTYRFSGLPLADCPLVVTDASALGDRIATRGMGFRKANQQFGLSAQEN